MKNSDCYVVVGTGSIAKRHISNLKQLFPNALIACAPSSNESSSIHQIEADKIFRDIREAIKANPICAIIASPTSLHLKNAYDFLCSDIPTLIEKPLCKNLKAFKEYKEVFERKKSKVEIGYCLRYQPAAMEFKKLIDEKNILGEIHSVIIDVGQYLPDWRPGIDYKKSVSAKESLGGGVLLELSHELDYINWLFGASDSVFCKAINTGSLNIDVEDKVDAILMRKDNFTINLHMDFLQRNPVRYCKVIGSEGNLQWDILRNKIVFKGSKEQEKVLFSEEEYDRNEMYLSMLVRFSRLVKENLKPLISLEEALNVVNLIESMKKSSINNKAYRVDISN